MTATEFNQQLLNLNVPLEKFAYHLTLKKSEVKDLVQETFLKALVNKEKYIYHENFKAWTFTIMRNTFINNYKRKLNQNNRYDLNEESFFITQIRHVGADDPDSTYSVMEIAHHIEQLKEKFRIPFKMHMSGFKYKEIADRLNLNIGTVKSRMSLSRKQLANQLDQ
jgi:RNA polymerase sigma-70 factor (ECF subfamily)